MNLLVTGAGGQLGRDVLKLLRQKGLEVTGITRDDLDFSQLDQVADRISAYNADWVINCAAYTQVDKAEEEPELAYKINRDAAREIALGVARTKGNLLHISTDFIFDGKKTSPYCEDDKPDPMNIYGKSKLEGEREINKILPNAIILRTAWVFGEHGNNFVKSILKLASENKELRVVNDQIGSPTWTVDIAKVVLLLIENNKAGVYHFASEGEISWYEVACEVVDVANQLDYEIVTENILPITTDEYSAPATRPAYSVLSNNKIKNIPALEVPGWKNSLHSMLKSYKCNSNTG